MVINEVCAQVFHGAALENIVLLTYDICLSLDSVATPDPISETHGGCFFTFSVDRALPFARVVVENVSHFNLYVSIE